MPTHYQVLGLAPGASEGEIKRAYRKMAVKLHPDKNPNDSQAAAKFQELGAAYAVLSDPAQRAGYDRTVGAGASAGAAGTTALARARQAAQAAAQSFTSAAYAWSYTGYNGGTLHHQYYHSRYEDEFIRQQRERQEWLKRQQAAEERERQQATQEQGRQEQAAQERERQEQAAQERERKQQAAEERERARREEAQREKERQRAEQAAQQATEQREDGAPTPRQGTQTEPTEPIEVSDLDLDVFFEANDHTLAATPTATPNHVPTSPVPRFGMRNPKGSSPKDPIVVEEVAGSARSTRTRNFTPSAHVLAKKQRRNPPGELPFMTRLPSPKRQQDFQFNTNVPPFTQTNGNFDMSGVGEVLGAGLLEPRSAREETAKPHALAKRAHTDSHGFTPKRRQPQGLLHEPVNTGPRGFAAVPPEPPEAPPEQLPELALLLEQYRQTTRQLMEAAQPQAPSPAGGDLATYKAQFQAYLDLYHEDLGVVEAHQRMLAKIWAAFSRLQTGGLACHAVHVEVTGDDARVAQRYHQMLVEHAYAVRMYYQAMQLFR